MEDTVSELLDLARLDEAEGPTPIDTLPEVDLDELVLDDTVQQRRVPVDTARVSAGRVHGRRDQLQRVVRNLLDNAARHATLDRRGRARAPTTTTVELTVDDDGPGIPAEDRERVFDRFTRLDDGRARDAGGLGLGPLDGQGDRRAARRHGRDRGRADRRRPPPRAPPGGLTPTVPLAMPELTIASFNCHAGLQARRNGVCEPYDLDAVLRGFDADVIVLQESWTPDGGTPAVAAVRRADRRRGVRAPVRSGQARPVAARASRRHRRAATWGSPILSRSRPRRAAASRSARCPATPRPSAAGCTSCSTSAAPRSTSSACTSRRASPTGRPSSCGGCAAQLPPPGRPAIVAGDCNFWGPGVQAFLPGLAPHGARAHLAGEPPAQPDRPHPRARGRHRGRGARRARCCPRSAPTTARCGRRCACRS